MSLSSLLRSAATEAQSVLAELGGAAPGRKNALYNGARLLVVWGDAQVMEVMRPGGGSSRRVLLTVTATRAQFSSAPAEKSVIVRTDVAPHIEYRIDTVDADDPLLYKLTVYRVGAAVP